MAERDLYGTLMICASQAGARLFRNNTGMGWVGKVKRRVGNLLTLENPRVLHSGLCNGSSDLIGWTQVRITDEMLGKTVAVFTAIEVKGDDGKPSKEQIAFCKAVKNSGGISAVVKSVDDLEAALIK